MNTLFSLPALQETVFAQYNIDLPITFICPVSKTFLIVTSERVSTQCLGMDHLYPYKVIKYPLLQAMTAISPHNTAHTKNTAG